MRPHMVTKRGSVWKKTLLLDSTAMYIKFPLPPQKLVFGFRRHSKTKRHLLTNSIFTLDCEDSDVWCEPEGWTLGQPNVYFPFETLDNLYLEPYNLSEGLNQLWDNNSLLIDGVVSWTIRSSFEKQLQCTVCSQSGYYKCTKLAILALLPTLYSHIFAISFFICNFWC